ncbi:MAG: hypothetical protein KKG01_06465 [Candidatus Omnitrophica bacterium]|nr:hypothetical protein [Candidatus Omnitrophota bacterium]MBU4590550.1 hypothetical protein [Candidatus Omnitrophota bacterium]
MIDKIALVASLVMPFWNIPLIIRIIKRRSSDDISIYWAVGIWLCLLAMLPSALKSDFIVWKAFAIGNLFMFTIVFLVTLLFHKKK